LPLKYREQQLKNLKRLIEENKDRLLQALHHDLHKNEGEALLMELDFVLNDIEYTLDNLEDWMAPRHKPRGLANIGDKVYTLAEPYGVVLLVAPWNYPIQLCLLPLVGIISAGNACVIKPSECAVACSNVLAELLPRYLDNECYAVATGGIPVSQAVLKERYDYIFYTGNTQVGRIVMEHAAKNLTPVTLELGGKSPVVIVEDADINVAAQRIVWGKYINAGQTCIAPDYVLCPLAKVGQLVECCQKAIKKYYGENPKLSKDYGRIINDRHFQRLIGVLRASKGEVVVGGESDATERYIAPTIVTNVAKDDKLMEEELFGPLLPILTVNSVDEAIQFVNGREKPLAFYVFSGSGSTFKKINRLTSAGGVVHNDVLMHASVLSLPFGGVGHSGFGSYHFQYSFETFSHAKPVVQTGTGLEAVNQLLRVPPFTRTNVNRIKWLMAPPKKRNPWITRLFVLCALVVVGALYVQKYGVPSWFRSLKGI
jgi:acyl-CoA reductase-like NAD-dependent aldehyde dehydrogenase